MLLVAGSMRELRLELLSQVYGYDLQQEMAFEDYLRQDFFQTKGAVYCVWVQDGQYVSALRLEPYEDGMVLAGLETAPDARGRGYATELIHAAMEWFGNGKVYAHIHHRNLPSVRVHQRCGFRKIADYAQFLDGSISTSAGTYLWKDTRYD